LPLPCSLTTRHAPLDPHLHTHCIVFNATFDPVENRWKALQNYELLRARKFAENAYYHELARELRGFGYRIRNRRVVIFRLREFSDELCDRFSKRDAEIDKALAKLLAEKPELAGANVSRPARLLATAERARKQKDLSRDELRELWDAQLTPRAERNASPGFQSVTAVHLMRNSACPVAKRCSGRRNICSTETRSCWNVRCGRRRWAGRAARISRLPNSRISPSSVATSGTERPGEVTLRDVLLREWEIVQTAKEGVGDSWPLVRIRVR
jgi:hypothetical protein